MFVQDYQRVPLRPLGNNDHRIMRVTPGEAVPRDGLIEFLRREPFKDPKEIEAQERQWRKDAALLPVAQVQFGRACRDGVYSVERAVELGGRAPQGDHDNSEPEGWISFDVERANFRVGSANGTLMIQASRVRALIADPAQKAAILFLETPPAYERTGEATDMLRNRLECFAEGLESIVAFTSRTLRVVFADRASCERFDELAQKIRCPDSVYQRVKAEPRNLYSVKLRKKVREMELGFDIRIAMQLDALLLNGSLCPDELLALKDAIADAASETRGGVEHAAEAMRRFAEELRHLDARSGKPYGANKDLVRLFRSVSADTSETAARSPVFASNSKCMQLTVTPTTMWLQGPFEDMSSAST